LPTLNKFSLEYLIVTKCFLQTITGAMSTLNPPVALEKKENEPRVEYIQDYASSKSIDLVNARSLALTLFSLYRSGL